MPILPNTPTSYVAANLAKLVAQSRQAFRYSNYELFTANRAQALSAHNGSISALVQDPTFCDNLHAILGIFGLNARASRLVNATTIQETLGRVSRDLDELQQGGVELATLDLHQRLLRGSTAGQSIRRVYEVLASAKAVTEVGGVVAASKTMHFLLPEIFIMIDRQHIATSLYNIEDYHPHPADGKGWATAVPGYSPPFKKANPSPQGAGGQLWDADRYLAALIFYKRIIREWCQLNNTTVQELWGLSPGVQASRVIDKALW